MNLERGNDMTQIPRLFIFLAYLLTLFALDCVFINRVTLTAYNTCVNKVLIHQFEAYLSKVGVIYKYTYLKICRPKPHAFI